MELQTPDPGQAKRYIYILGGSVARADLSLETKIKAIHVHNLESQRVQRCLYK